MRQFFRAERLAALSAMGLLLFASGCARQPPTSNSLSGKRLRVTMNFKRAVNPLFHYYFLINYNTTDGRGGSKNAPGPIPTLVPPYGNGFATGSGGTQGFTDFVVYDNQQTQGYGLYHVVALNGNNQSNFVSEGRPVSVTQPNVADVNDTNAGTQLKFDLDMSQLVVDAAGVPLTDQNQAANIARQIQWLQVNIVATNIVPIDATTLQSKIVDSMGDTRTSSGQAAFLTLDVSQNRVVDSSSFVGQLLEEPEQDQFSVQNLDYNPTLDLVSWSIEVIQQ